MKFKEILQKYKSSNTFIRVCVIIFIVFVVGGVSYSSYKYHGIYKTKKALSEQLSILEIDRSALNGMKVSTDTKRVDLTKRINDTFKALSPNITNVIISTYYMDIMTNKQYIYVILEYKSNHSDEMKDLVARLYLSKDVYKIMKVNRRNIEIIIKGE